MKKHTPTPWTAPPGFESIWGADSACVATMNTGLDNSDANARHIVACVNACEGINPIAVKGLLAALEALVGEAESIPTRTLDARIGDARAALAKAKER